MLKLGSRVAPEEKNKQSVPSYLDSIGMGAAGS
jgi:hypothetical protein